MGCGSSKLDVTEKDAMTQNAKIDRLIKQDKKTEARTIKILLLGEFPEIDVYMRETKIT